MTEVLMQTDIQKADPNYRRVADILGVEDFDKDLENVMSIYDWAKNKAGEDPLDIMLLIRNTARTLGGNPEETRLTTLRRYVTLDQEHTKLDKELQLMRKEDNGGS